MVRLEDGSHLFEGALVNRHATVDTGIFDAGALRPLRRAFEAVQTAVMALFSIAK